MSAKDVSISTDVHPSRWATSFADLEELEQDAMKEFGWHCDQMTMRDIANCIVEKKRHPELLTP